MSPMVCEYSDLKSILLYILIDISMAKGNNAQKKNVKKPKKDKKK
jgi:hypothetical protein